MNTTQQKHLDALCQEHINALISQGKSKVTIESYAREVRRISKFLTSALVNYRAMRSMTTSPTEFSRYR